MGSFMLLEKAASSGNNTTPQGGGWLPIVFFAVMIVILYFIMIRPQRKQQKQEAKMRSELQIGDEIITIGGIYGRVVSLKDDSIVIESSGDRSKIQVTRAAVAQNLTIKDESK